MKTAIFSGFNMPLQLADAVMPEPREGQILLKVCRCGICGSDLHMTKDPTFGLKGGEVIGHEFSGEIIEMGRNVTGLKVGDQISAAPLRGCGHCAACLRGEPAWCAEHFELIGGGYAQFTALDSRQCRKLPVDISLADGALAEPLAVALHGVTRSGLRPGARVLVVGAGAIGLAVAFWARRMGAKSVTMLDLHDLQKERALNLGATGFVTSGDDLHPRVEAALGGPADIVFECVGNVGLIDHCIDLVRPRGEVVVLGLCTKPDRLDSFRAISKEVTITMSVFFDMSEFESAIDVLDAQTYAPTHLISDTVSLTELPTAFEALRNRSHQCKVMVDPFL